RLSANLEVAISNKQWQKFDETGLTLYALKDVNEIAPVLSIVLDNYRKAIKAATKLTEKENLITQVEIARDAYKFELDNTIL
ncbi:hypothetical protein PanWU01x14_152760, partial [Parasponia andersonii]